MGRLKDTCVGGTLLRSSADAAVGLSCDDWCGGSSALIETLILACTAGGRGQRALLLAILRAAISEPESLLDVGGRVPDLTRGLFFTMLVGVPSLAGCRVLP